MGKLTASLNSDQRVKSTAQVKNSTFQIITYSWSILFPDDELVNLDLDEDELLFEVCSTEDFIVVMILTGLRIR